MGLLLRKTKQVLGTFLLRPWPSPPPSPHRMSPNLAPHALPLPSIPATKEKALRKGRKAPHTERPGACTLSVSVSLNFTLYQIQTKCKLA